MSNNPFLNPSTCSTGHSNTSLDAISPSVSGGSMTYAAPNHPPPSNTDPANGHQRRPSNYAPTNTPTPGQPLLLQGKMLVYPNGWQGCPKCQDTGFKHGDPTHPCRKCWQSYGQRYNPLLVSSSGMQGAKVLQKPLPLDNRLNGAGSSHYNGGMSNTGRISGGNAGYPGTTPTFSYQQQPQSTGGSYQIPPQMSGTYQPPPHPPIGNTANGRRSPPQVIRAQDAREDNEDEDGEAPPAYADAVAAGPDGVLPPQRRDEQGRLLSPLQADSAIAAGRPSNSMTPQITGTSVQPNSMPGTFPPPPLHPSHASPAAPPHHQYQSPMGMPYYGNHHPNPSFSRPAQIIPYGHMPPPGAIVLRPGDPRIGGRLCYKCGGEGIRDSLWWGSETCYHCGGSGRIMG